jgi:hypothetical protein
VLREFALSDLRPALVEGQHPIILHFGDHDPSGIDMSRDLTERLRMFAGTPGKFTRVALNMDQVQEQQPPPNPAKTTDSRFESYAREFGDESWELDALQPAYLAELVREHTQQYIDEELWENRSQEIADVKSRLGELADTF